MAIPTWSTTSSAGKWCASFEPSIALCAIELSINLHLGTWQVGQLIQSKGGVVTAEQLAPFMDLTPDDLEKIDGYTNESYMVRHLLFLSSSLLFHSWCCQCRGVQHMT